MWPGFQPPMRISTIALAAGLGLWSVPALADEWETVATGDVLVKSRDKAGTSVREIWAEGTLDAPLQDIQNTLMDPESFPSFMPYVKEGRNIGKPDPDGTTYVYIRLELPMLAARDYVTRVNLDKGVNSDGSGEFRNRWLAVPDKFPSRHNVVRLRINEGSWHVTPQSDGKCHAVYRFAVDPGGWIPAFAADLGNKSGVTDTFKAVEKEARRRAAARKTQAASKP